MRRVVFLTWGAPSNYVLEWWAIFSTILILVNICNQLVSFTFSHLSSSLTSLLSLSSLFFFFFCNKVMFIKLVSSFICSFFIKGLTFSCSGSGEKKYTLLSHGQKHNLQHIIQQYSQNYQGFCSQECPLAVTGCQLWCQCWPPKRTEWRKSQECIFN